MPTNETIGLRIKSLRKAKGISQEELAKSIGVTRQMICNYETGDSKPGDELKKEIAIFFGEKIEDLFFKD